METDWPREDPYLPLSAEEARRLLGAEVYGVERIAEGKVNSNYRVETTGGPVLLRLHHGADHVVEIEAALAARLVGRLPTARLLGQGPRHLVFQWLPGVSLERALAERRDLPYERIARDLAAARRAMDEVRFDRFGFLRPDLTSMGDWNTAVGAYFDYLRTKLQPPTLDHDFAARIEETVDAAEPHLREMEGTPVLVHGDFKPTNLLVDERGLVAVIDWEFAHSGTRLSDAGQLLRHTDDLPPGFAEAFGAELGLDADVLLLARVLDLTNLVQLRSKAISLDHPSRAAIERLAYRVCDEYEARFGL